MSSKPLTCAILVSAVEFTEVSQLYIVSFLNETFS